MSKLSRLIAILFVFTCLVGPVQAEDDLLAKGHPSHYVVKKGDTLWDIASYFLKDPWRWPDIWYVNPQVENPHLIYPGDELELVYMNGKPQLRLKRGNGVVKLSPQVRSTPWDGAIPVVPIDAIAPFLSRSAVMSGNEVENSPYIVGFADEHIVAGPGQSVYVREIQTAKPEKYDVLRPEKPFRDADTGEILGYRAQFVASGLLRQTGDPATVFLQNSEIEAIIGDRLLPSAEDTMLSDFYPTVPSERIDGSIIAVLNGISQIGQYNVVAIDRGASDGLEPGMVLKVWHKGETVRDTVSWMPDTVTLPDEEAGVLLVFRSFERVSLGLIMHATRAIHVLDRVRNP